MELDRDDLAMAESFVRKVRWRFASTMLDWPHEYTVRSWRPELSEEFERFCAMIERHGFRAPWPPPPSRPTNHNCYLVIGDYKYWAMGPRGDRDTVAEKTVINRASHPDPERLRPAPTTRISPQGRR